MVSEWGRSDTLGGVRRPLQRTEGGGAAGCCSQALLSCPAGLARRPPCSLDLPFPRSPRPTRCTPGWALVSGSGSTLSRPGWWPAGRAGALGPGWGAGLAEPSAALGPRLSTSPWPWRLGGWGVAASRGPRARKGHGGVGASPETAWFLFKRRNRRALLLFLTSVAPRV